MNQQWEYFKEKYNDPIFQPLIEYIQKEWLNDCPERFLHCYTSEYLHLGEIATSRTEGAHWLLKQDLQVSINDLLVLLQNFDRVINLQFNKIITQIENKKVRKPANSRNLFNSLAKRILIKAI
jgi:hypothetical protein